MDMIRKSIAKTDLVNLAIHAAQKYREIQIEVNDNLLPGEKPLPDWTAASILQHIRYHNLDPQLQQWVRMTEVQELLKIALDASVVRDEDTGEIKINPIQAKMYIELSKQMEILSKSNASEKVFYSGGEHIDSESVGFISLSGKSLISQWKSSK
jgi:hypothetical protein